MRHSSVRSRSPHKGFHPSDVAAIRNGYWWTASGTTGFGTTGFRIIEQNGHSSFDQIQATVANQPTQLTENGGVQFRMRKSADSNPSTIRTSGNVQAGWTGDTYVAGWFRLPDASGDITNPNGLLQHTASAAGQRRLNFFATINTDRVTAAASTDGTTTAQPFWDNVFLGGLWIWLELLIVPGTSFSLVKDLSTVAFVTEVTPGAQLFDGNTPLGIGCRPIASAANGDTTDWATVYYANGIPTAGERALLARHAAPIAVSF